MFRDRRPDLYAPLGSLSLAPTASEVRRVTIYLQCELITKIYSAPFGHVWLIASALILRWRSSVAWNKQAATLDARREKRASTSKRERAAGAKVDLGVLPRLLGYNLRRANQASWRTYVSFIGENKIRPGLFSLLCLVRSNPGIAQIELGTHLGVDKASIVALLDRLERAGLIERRRSTRDRRRQGISLTEAGSRGTRGADGAGASARAPHGEPLQQEPSSISSWDSCTACIDLAPSSASLSAAVSGFMNQPTLAASVCDRHPVRGERCGHHRPDRRDVGGRQRCARPVRAVAARNRRSTWALLVKAMASTAPALQAREQTFDTGVGRRRRHSDRARPRRTRAPAARRKSISGAFGSSP